MVLPTLRESLLDASDDLDVITKQMLEYLLDHEKKTHNEESISHLAQLFETKQAEIKKLLDKVSAYQKRAALIEELEKCVENRDMIIQKVEADLKCADSLLMHMIFQANERLKTMKAAEEQPVNTEQVIQMAHQISKGFSVASPLNWQQGDASRPFPTEVELKIGHLSAPRTTGLPPVGPTLGMRPQTTPTGRGAGQRTVPVSPLASGYTTQRSWSPRTAGFGESPRTIRNGMGSAMPTPRPVGTSPFDSRRTSTSSDIRVSFTSPPQPTRNMLAPVSNIGQISSDSSSSSSSDDETRR
ncbi:unnamed protein product, partial [Mesorhabditis belari]|uniref:Mediator of RNA polymerase II transcription subunit 4 n=1 Tax=Mesorhabditis belari TaxID=2138241 RepID=A0AAF3EPC9_9BILA